MSSPSPASGRKSTQNLPENGPFASVPSLRGGPREGTQVYFEDVDAGDAIPALTVTVDETQMFFFSAATYNGHRIHYDKEWARDKEGYDDVLVQGPLQAALLARAITDWIGGRGRLVNYSVQNRGVAFPGQPLTFGGTVTAKRI